MAPQSEDTWQEHSLSLRIGVLMLYAILIVVFFVLLFAYVRVRSRRLSR
jgi:heme/copper-type cytochrome/quinol oxidase subunit 2